MTCKVTYEDILEELAKQRSEQGIPDTDTSIVSEEVVDDQGNTPEAGASNPFSFSPVGINFGLGLSTIPLVALTRDDSVGDPEDPFSETLKPSKTQEFIEFEKLAKTENVVALSRKMRVIPRSEFGSNREEFIHNSSPSRNADFFVNDYLRGRLGNYWSLDQQKGTINYTGEGTDASPFTILSYANGGIVDSAQSNGFGRTEQVVVLKAKPEHFGNANRSYSSNLWQKYIVGGIYDGSTSGLPPPATLGIRTQQNPRAEGEPINFEPTVLTSQEAEFSDHLHDMPLPFSQKELDKLNNPMRSLVADIKGEYNLYLKSFENKTSEPSVSENTLPNMYVFLSQLDSENPNPEFTNFVTLENTIQATDKLLSMGETKNADSMKELPIVEYYEMYARKHEQADLSRLNQRFSNIVLSDKDFSLIKEYNEKRAMFPMYMDIKFSTDKTTTIAQSLKDTKLSNTFMSGIVNKLINEENPLFLNCAQSVETNIQESEVSNLKKSVSVTQQRKRIWDVTGLIQEFANSDEMLSSDSAIYLGDYQNQVDVMGSEQSVFIKNLMFTIFLEKLRKLVRDKFRTYEQVMKGTPAYSETILYRVAKFEGGPNGNPIQNYYFPNSNEVDVLRFIDTQVKYGKQYSYVVYAYQMVIGNKYQYRELSASENQNTATFKVYNEPSLVLFEHQFYSFTGKVIDNPPVPPDFNIIPYKGVDDRILITMNSNVGDFVTDPIIISQEDQERVDDIRAQKQLGPGDPIRFKVEDGIGTFEVYRTETAPKSYLDFEGKLRGIINTDVDLNSKQSATAAAFVDRVEPNKKYYYIFRSVDNHDNFSNPTPVVRVEVVNENGTIFMLKDTVDFVQEPKVSSKSARRFIQLVPNVLQTIIDEEASGFNTASTASEVKNKIRLGVSDDALWGKNFKIRLTSKSTGKKIDFRVKFRHEHKEKA